MDGSPLSELKMMKVLSIMPRCFRASVTLCTDSSMAAIIPHLVRRSASWMWEQKWSSYHLGTCTRTAATEKD